jgi:hypothetical protein
MSDNTLVNDTATEATDVESGTQAQTAKTYTQDEVDGMMARMKGSLQKKLLKPYEDLGDPDELRSIKTEWEKKQQETQVKKGEFEKVLQDLAAKKDAEISKRDSIIKEYKVNSPLLSAAAKYRAVNADQVKALLGSSVRLNDDGDVEVIDTQGKVRYTDTGSAFGVEDLVREFLDSNPHFVSASPSNTNTRSNISNGQPAKIDITKLDMKNPEHRKVYAEYRKTAGIA